MPYTPNNASAALPGTIGLTNELLAAVLERIAEQAIVTGFKNVILMGDHGGGRAAERLPRHREEARREVRAEGHPRLLLRRGLHEADGGLRRVPQVAEPAGRRARVHLDTSEMLYLGGDKGWVRKELIQDGGAAGAAAGQPAQQRDFRGRPAVDGRALGKRMFDMKIDYAVRQIQQLLAAPKPQG